MKIFKEKKMNFRSNKMINKLAVILFVLGGLISKMNAQGIEFMYDLDDAIAKAKLEKKLVFVDFYTSWCGPCKVLDKTIFPVEKVGDFFNENFISCKVQCDDKGIGEELGKKYDVIAYPTLMFLNEHGEMVHVEAGASSAEALIEIAQIALNPEQNLMSMIKEWNSGNRDEEFVNLYFQRLKQYFRNVKASEDLLTYFNELSPTGKMSKNTFELFELVGVAPLTSIFDYLENNYAAFAKNVGKDEIDGFIAKGYLWYFKYMSENTPKEEFQLAMERFKAKNYPYYDEYELFYKVFKAANNIEEYQKLGTEFLRKYGKNKDVYAIALTSLLGNLTGKPGEGMAGIQWMEDLLKHNDDPQYLDTYIYILWRNHEFDEAIRLAKRLRSITIEQGRSAKQIDDQIDVIIAMKEKYN